MSGLKALENMNIDLSGLDALQDIDWDEHTDNQEAIDYLNSEEIKQEMKRVQEDVQKAMKEVRIEMQEIEKINWEEINRTIEEAMKEVEIELSKIKKNKEE